MSSGRQRILFIAASGIGNTMLATPHIEAVRNDAAELVIATGCETYQYPLTQTWPS